ncbi:hypothetical protein LZ30DRAFT_195139 [Colletotrichum cereale]|nr:hypothetical protein LZ30DRAFT_195139 [Colletotrichum cereale]
MDRHHRHQGAGSRQTCWSCLSRPDGGIPPPVWLGVPAGCQARASGPVTAGTGPDSPVSQNPKGSLSACCSGQRLCKASGRLLDQTAAVLWRWPA